MTLFIRQIRALIFETPLRQKKPESSKHCPPTQARRKSLSVKISKEPPAIVYFERDKLEDSFECIFDPQVHHDEEKDHPDLFEKNEKKELKPWQKPPYCSSKPPTSSFLSRFKSTFNRNSISTTTATSPMIMHQSNHSAEQVA
jgi:hypothetical protein